MSAEKIIEIAVLVAGIDEEYQSSVIEGINDSAKRYNVNVSYFSAFGGVMTSSLYDIGEYNIYELVNYDKYDGAILLTNTINDPVEKKKIVDKAKCANIPVVVLDCDDYNEFYNISIDNSAAMRDIVRHVIKVHNARNINYVSGPLVNPEALDRYEAFIQVMKENNIEVDERRVYFGEFRAIDGVRSVENILSSGLPMPDAIICANDAMALAAVVTLEDHGYVIPRDVIVTGFDNTYYASHYCPSLTTVSRPLFDAGYKACEQLVKLIGGEVFDNNIVLKSEAVFSESCGCLRDDHDDMRTYKKSTFKVLEKCRTDISLLNRMTSELADTESKDANVSIVGKYFRETDCDQFCMCLCSDWEGAFSDELSSSSINNYHINGYTPKMSSPMIWSKGKISSVDSFNSEDIFPKPFTTGGNVSYIFPLHFRARCLGYCIISNGSFPYKSLLCHSMLMNISNSIDNIRKLIYLNSVIDELNKLYVVDPLCGIYNRNGFIKNTEDIYKKCEREGLPILISFIDMDGLKSINDSYGHKEGDFALQKLASVILSCSKNGRICARFGGDEFIIFGAATGMGDIEPLESAFLEQLEKMNRMIDKPYNIDASIGTVVTDVKPDIPLFSIITQADEIMYERKKKKKTSKYLRR